MNTADTHTQGTTTDASAGDGAIVVGRLTKSYGDIVAVRDLSLTVARGEIFALLGPNGAGKTTTVEILEGYRPADSGTVRVLGLDPRRDGARLKPRIGVMLQQDGIYNYLTARELLELFARFYSAPEDPERLLQVVGLTDAAATRCRQLSGGQKRRLSLALALVGRPELIFLDEPTTGMDPQARRATWEMLRELRDRGATLLLTTHFMDEAERLADRIAIIDHGELLALDTPAGLTRAQSTTTTEVRFTAPGAVDIAALGRLPGARLARSEASGAYMIETGDAAALLVELTKALQAAGVTLSELRVGRTTLEDVFLQLTGKEIRE
jgi:ABC-2 type transport system ATP-binding protein